MTDADKVEKLKECGNEYMKGQPPDFNKAITAYTEALDIDANCHTVLSNRSLALFKLCKYEEALKDAERAIHASPQWPKGYLRKCYALNALGRNQDVQQTAQQGFLLMHSTSFCREFVDQWLKACENIYTEDKLLELLPPGPAQLFQVIVKQKAMITGGSGSLIPEGLKILSDAYWRVLFYCMASRLSPLLELSHDAMRQYLIEISDEFERIMGLFGHTVGSVVMEWAILVGEAIDGDLLIQIKPQSIRATEKLVKCLENDLHCTLYPVVRCLLLLAVSVVTTRMYMLNAANTGFHSICHMITMCLPLFDCSLLNTSEYVCNHMNVLAGLIDCYNRRSTDLSYEECSVLSDHCKKLESLLPLLASQFPKAYQQLHEPFEYIIGTAKTAVLSKNTGVTIPFVISPNRPCEDPVENAKKQMKLILQKSAEMVTISDAEEIISQVDVFFKSGDVSNAQDALLAGEKLLLPLIGVQIQQGGFTLNEVLSTIRGFRLKVLVAAALLKETNPKLVCDIIIRWKGLFSEFKTVAIREGLRETFISTSHLFHKLKALHISDATDKIISLKKNHQSSISTFFKCHAYRCWSTVAHFPLLLPVEKVLTPDELIIEYALIGKYDEADLKASLDLFILALKPDGTRELTFVGEKACTSTIKKWIKQWNLVTAGNLARSTSDEEKKLEMVGKELVNILFPPVIQQHIKHPEVKHIYLSPEPHFSMLPLKLLPGEDGLPLFQGRTISHLGSCRELLRLEIMAQLGQEYQKSALHHQPASPQLEETSMKFDSVFPTTIKPTCEKVIDTKDCYIFADPNFDHQRKPPTSKNNVSLWEQLYALNPFRPEIELCHQLEYSFKEAHLIEEILGLRHPELCIHLLHSEKANLESVVSLKSPLLVHFSTHGFGHLNFQFDALNLNQEDSESGLALAGINTYMAKKFEYIDPTASTGMLTALTVCGLDLTNTRLVFLSTCVSGIGTTQLQESTNSIANAFRTAGALTVIATTWSIADNAAVEFVKHFYNALCCPETRPSEALNIACDELSEDPRFSSWRHWAGFTCYGDDIPVFSK